MTSRAVCLDAEHTQACGTGSRLAPVAARAMPSTSVHPCAAAATGCDAGLHVASPFPAKAPKHPDELIVPARDGTLRALRSARDASVRRTVLTSSFAAIGYGHRDNTRVFTEADWSDPVGIFGADCSVYVEVVERLLNGKLPAIPRVTFGVVDVRDVADLHVRAMVEPGAAGERFLAAAGVMSLPEIANLLRVRLGPAARRVPTRTASDWAIRLGALVSPRFATVVPDLGVARQASSAKAREVLGWRPRADRGDDPGHRGRLGRPGPAPQHNANGRRAADPISPHRDQHPAGFWSRSARNLSARRAKRWAPRSPDRARASSAAARTTSRGSPRACSRRARSNRRSPSA